MTRTDPGLPNIARRLVCAQVVGLFLATSIAPLQGLAAPVTPPASLAQTPQFLQPPPDPNVFVTVDNSGSMLGEYLPDTPAFSVVERLFPNPFTTPYASSGTSSTINPTFQGFNHVIDVARARSSDQNLMYYNPSLRYRPWVTFDAAGNLISYPNASATNALFNPVHPTVGSLNLTQSTVTGYNFNAYDGTNHFFNPTYTARFDVANASSATTPFALYYLYTGPRNAAGVPTAPGDATLANYQRIEVDPVTNPTYNIPAPHQRGQPDEPGCSGNVCDYNAEIQNFANWFQYYRSRTLLARGAMGNAIAGTSASLRIGLGLINPPSGVLSYNVDTFRSGTVRLGMRSFQGAQRKTIFDLLHNHDVGGGTPSGRALVQVGHYFDNTWPYSTTPGVNSPWADQPTVNGTQFAACRRSFHIYSTDGFWNETRSVLYGPPTSAAPDLTGAAYTAGIPDEVDNAAGPLVCPPGISSGPRCYQYNPASTTQPFTNSIGNTNNLRYLSPEQQTLADIAMYYWYRDLQPNMPNTVPPNAADPSFWQNLSTIAVALALVGTKTNQGSTFLTNLDTAADVWPAPVLSNANDPKAADDLWHAAVNSHGRLLAAADPAQLSKRLGQALNEIGQRTVNASGAASSSAVIRNGTAVFTTEFNNGVWSGDLYRRDIDPATLQFKATGLVDSAGTPYVWRASQLIAAPASRKIFSMTTTGTKVDFLSIALDATQLGLLASSIGSAPQVIDYVRGVRSNEQSQSATGVFRDRPSTVTGGLNNVLGTIANSTPLFVKDDNFMYQFLPTSVAGQNTYATYQQAKQQGLSTPTNPGQAPQVWVGSNDGMFHAFDATAGTETYAYVPRSIIRNLPLLADPAYQHQMMVDGVPAAGDAFLGGAWRTVVVSTLGAAGRGIFAIDATDPAALNASSVLWEADEYSLAATEYDLLGHTFGSAIIARIGDTAGGTSAGQWVAVVPNGPESTSQQAALFVLDLQTGAPLKVLVPPGQSGSNGLLSATPVLDKNRHLVGVYGGDLQGNLWRFDFAGPNASQWNVGFGGVPLIQARNRNAQAQPIFAKPMIAPHPNGGVMVAFGTGKLFSPGDRTDATEQTLYAVWAPFNASATAITNFRAGTEMVQQAITSKSGSPAVYTVTNFPVNYLSGKRGWYLDLGVQYGVSGSTVNTGSANLVTPRERMVTPPITIGTTLVGLSFVPPITAVDPCSLGQSFLYGLDLLTGTPVNGGTFVSAGAGSGAIEVGGALGLAAFRLGSGQPPCQGQNCTPPPPPPCPPGTRPIWIAGVAGGAGHWECIPEGPTSEARAWRQILE